MRKRVVVVVDMRKGVVMMISCTACGFQIPQFRTRVFWGHAVLNEPETLFSASTVYLRPWTGLAPRQPKLHHVNANFATCLVDVHYLTGFARVHALTKQLQAKFTASFLHAYCHASLILVKAVTKQFYTLHVTIVKDSARIGIQKDIVGILDLTKSLFGNGFSRFTDPVRVANQGSFAVVGLDVLARSKSGKAEYLVGVAGVEIAWVG